MVNKKCPKSVKKKPNDKKLNSGHTVSKLGQLSVILQLESDVIERVYGKNGGYFLQLGIIILNFIHVRFL
jgi:hypothetical protein